MLKNNSEPSYTNMDLIKTYFNEYIEPRIRNT